MVKGLGRRGAGEGGLWGVRGGGVEVEVQRVLESRGYGFGSGGRGALLEGSVLRGL